MYDNNYINKHTKEWWK